MTEFFAELFSGVSPWLATVLTAMTPVGELRLSIPLALTQYELSPLASYGYSIVGNLIPVILLLWLLDPLARFLRRWRMFDRFFTWLFDRTRRKYTERFYQWGAIALISFVAIPLPITGGWTGAVAAFVFGVPFRQALPLIFIGLLIAGLIVLGISQGAITLFSSNLLPVAYV